VYTLFTNVINYNFITCAAEINFLPVHSSLYVIINSFIYTFFVCLTTGFPDMYHPMIQWSVEENLECILEKIIVARFNIKC
jgi:hypothetical protein